MFFYSKNYTQEKSKLQKKFSSNQSKFRKSLFKKKVNQNVINYMRKRKKIIRMLIYEKKEIYIKIDSFVL